MATRFIQIFWGLLLVIFDFQINGLDVLPDVFGYILVALGCGGLSSASPRFTTAALLAWAMLILTLASLAIRVNFAPLFILATVMDCAMMWFLLGGVMQLADSRQRRDLSQRASSRRIAYVTIASLSTLLGILVGGHRDWAEIAIALTVSIIVVLFLILHLIYRAIRELSDGTR